MAKKTVAIISAVLFTLIFSGNVFAAFDDIYTTGTYGGTDIKTTFGWDEKPWLYLKLPAPYGNLSAVNSSWTDPYGVSTSTAEKKQIFQEVWLGFDNWNTLRTTGVWNVAADYSYVYGGYSSGNGATTFTVTPEPLSAALFLFGGAALAAAYRKKKAKS